MTIFAFLFALAGKTPVKFWLVAMICDTTLLCTYWLTHMNH